jgi:hypothetical protein
MRSKSHSPFGFLLRCVRCLLSAAAVIFAAVPAQAQCDGDYWAARSSNISQQSGTSVLIVSTTNLNHTKTHPNCGSNVKAKAQLVGPSSAPSCSAGPSTGTHTQAQPERHAAVCPQELTGHMAPTTGITPSCRNLTPIRHPFLEPKIHAKEAVNPDILRNVSEIRPQTNAAAALITVQ